MSTYRRGTNDILVKVSTHEVTDTYFLRHHYKRFVGMAAAHDVGGNHPFEECPEMIAETVSDCPRRGRDGRSDEYGDD